MSSKEKNVGTLRLGLRRTEMRLNDDSDAQSCGSDSSGQEIQTTFPRMTTRGGGFGGNERNAFGYNPFGSLNSDNNGNSKKDQCGSKYDGNNEEKKCFEKVRLKAEGPFITETDTEIVFCWNFWIMNNLNQDLCDADFSFDIRSYQVDESFALGPGIFGSDPGPTYSVSTTLASGSAVADYRGTGLFYENATVPPGSFSLTLCAAFDKEQYEDELVDTRLLTSVFSVRARARDKCGTQFINVSECVENCKKKACLPVLLQKVGSDVYYNEETMLFEACYTVTIQNLTGFPQTGITVTDNVRAQYVAAGVEDPDTELNIEYVTIDAEFVNPDFVGIGSTQTDVLVENRSLDANETQTIVYLVSFPRICVDLPLGVYVITNLVEMRYHCQVGDQRVLCFLTARAKTNVSTAEYRGRLEFSKRFCEPLLDGSNKRIDLPVLLDIANVGNTSATLASLIDDVATQLGSTAFSIVAKSSSILCAGRGGTSTAPPVNAAFNGNSVTEVLDTASGAYKVGPGQAVRITFTIRLNHAALLHLDTLENKTFTNSATLTWTDVVCRTASCTSSDKFRCSETPRLVVVQSLEYLRYRKRRINVYESVPYPAFGLTQFQIAYEASVNIEIVNTGNGPVCDVDAQLLLQETLNGGVVYHAEVVSVQATPVGAPALVGRAAYTGQGVDPSTTRLIDVFDLQPNQGVIVCVHFDYVPPNNSIPGVINVPAPTCDTPPSDQSPAVSGFGDLTVVYGATCSDPPAINVRTPIVSRECPRITLCKTVSQPIDLSNAFTQTTDIYFQVNANSQAGALDPQPLPDAPPPQYNCYQTTFVYKVTNNGDVPLDNILICDTFFDQLEAAGILPNPPDGFCTTYVVKPPVLISESPDEGSIGGNSGWTGTSADPVLAQANIMMLPGASLEFSVIVRFCINPKISIRASNLASVRARTPNEGLVIGFSRTILPIIGPSLCVSKTWDTNYPVEQTPGVFIGKLCYIVYNDGDRRVLDLQITDDFTQGIYTVTQSPFPPGTLPEDSVRNIVSPTCTTVEGESNFDVTWTGSAAGNINVNTPVLEFLDRSERYTVCTTPFIFEVDGITANPPNVVNICGFTSYDNPNCNSDAVLTDLSAYSGYVGPGDTLPFGTLCRSETLDVELSNFINPCPTGPQTPVQTVATVISSEPGCTIYELEFEFSITNLNGNGTTVGVATIESVDVTATTVSYGSGVTSQGLLDIVDPSPIAPGATGIVTWKERIKWAGSYPDAPPTLNFLTYNIHVDNTYNLNPADCPLVFNPQTLPVFVLGNFIHNCPSPGTFLTPVSAVATFDGGSSGDWRYTMEYAFTFDNLDDDGGTAHAVTVDSVSVSPSSPGAPFQSLGITITNDPTPVAPGASGLVQWTEEIRYTGAEGPPTPPPFPDPTYTLEVDNTVGADSDSCALTYTAPTFP